MRGQDYREQAFGSFLTPSAGIPVTEKVQSETADPPTNHITPPNSDTPNNISDSMTTDSSTTPMDTTSNIRLSTTYYQTRNTRRSGTSTTLHNLDTCSNSNTCTTHIGSYDMDNSINSTFLASRSNHNTNTHQNILLTFDPSDMSCTSCTTPHNITIPEPDSTVTYILSDQNFPGWLGGGGVVTALEL